MTPAQTWAATVERHAMALYYDFLAYSPRHSIAIALDANGEVDAFHNPDLWPTLPPAERKAWRNTAVTLLEECQRQFLSPPT